MAQLFLSTTTQSQNSVTERRIMTTLRAPVRRQMLWMCRTKSRHSLEAAGYEVVLLRTDSSTPVSKRDRVKKAVDAKADIGISIHTDATGGLNQVWSQKVGSFRENINAGHERVEFSNAATATTSQKYADAFKTAREAAEGREVGRDPDSSSQAGAFSKDREGLFSWVILHSIMLWADTIPWVYNEIARDNGRALSADLKQKSITGIVNGVKAAIPSWHG